MQGAYRAPDWMTGWFPFWFWNDRLTAEEIRWQIGQMAAQGVDGFLICARQGLQQPYLAEAFFDLATIAVEEAERLGLIVVIYDELPYPSGAAGGEVLLGNPQFFATELVQKTFDVTGGAISLPLPRGKTLSCVACPMRRVENADWSEQLDLIHSVGPVLVESVYQQTGLTAYNRKRFFTGAPTPVLETTLPAGNWRLFVSSQVLVEHHKYYHHFVDPLNPAAIAEFIRLTHDRWHVRLGQHFGKTIRAIFTDETAPIWSDRLPAEYAKRFGDLFPLLPALHDSTHPNHSGVRANLNQIRYEMFVESYDQPIAKWCQDHGIEYWGEKPSVRLEQLKYFDTPGCDVGHTKVGASLAADLLGAGLRMNAKAVASAAYFYGKPAALCEAYHSLGWGATLADLKRIADGLLLLGVTCIVPHAFYFSTHGLRKHDAPPSLFFQMPWWPLFGKLVQHTRAVTKAMHGTHPHFDVLLLDPSTGVPTPAQWAEFARVQAILMKLHIEFLIIAIDVKIDAGTVMVPPMPTDSQAERWLSDFTTAGGSIIRLAKGFDESELARIGRRNRLRVIQGDDADVWLATRIADDGVVMVMVLNIAAHEVIVELDAVRHRLSSGELRVVHQRTEPSGSAAGSLTVASNNASSSKSAASSSIYVNLENAPVTVHPLQANLLRFGRWNMTANETTAVVSPAPIINQLTEAKIAFVPAIQQAFGAPAELRLPMLHVRYAAEFENAGFTGPVELLVEPGSIAAVQWSIRANDGKPRTAANLRPSAAGVRGTFGIDITADLVPGINRIEVELATDAPDGGLLNPLYLAGDFAAGHSPLSIRPWTEIGMFERYTESGLPFYSGVVDYRTKFRASGDESAVELDLGSSFEEACEVSINGGAWHGLPWRPHRVPVSATPLEAGDNDLVIRVYTTLIRSFEGQFFDVTGHAYAAIEQDAIS